MNQNEPKHRPLNIDSCTVKLVFMFFTIEICIGSNTPVDIDFGSVFFHSFVWKFSNAAFSINELNSFNFESWMEASHNSNDSWRMVIHFFFSLPTDIFDAERYTISIERTVIFYEMIDRYSCKHGLKRMDRVYPQCWNVKNVFETVWFFCLIPIE